MKLLIFGFCLLLITYSDLESQVDSWQSMSNITTDGLERVLVSWHIGNLDRFNLETDLVFVAALLAPADLIVFQGVAANQNNTKAIAKLCELMNSQGNEWDYLLTDPTPKSVSGIRYACLWRTRRINVRPYQFNLCQHFDFMINKPALISFNVGLIDYQLYVCHFAEDSQVALRELESMTEQRGEFGISKIILAGSFNASPEALQSSLGESIEAEILIKIPTLLKKRGDRLERLKCDDNVLLRGVDVKISAPIDFDKYFLDPQKALIISNHLPIAAILRLR